MNDKSIVAKLTQGEVVAIDGKALKGSKDGDKGAIYVVNAWARANGIVLGQVKVEEKSNEITAIAKLLKLLAIKGCIITIDAIGCQKDIVKEIIEKEADYVLSLKENHPVLYKEIKMYFEDSIASIFKEESMITLKKLIKGMGV